MRIIAFLMSDISHSHARGTNKFILFIQRQKIDSFPHAWNKLKMLNTEYVQERLIPTCVG